jgi:glucan phosphoethanolaminetransferase (alkaline phosphatase superfamily)
MAKKKEARKAESKEDRKEEKKVPLGVKIISVVVYVSSALLLFDALAYIFYGITGEGLSSDVTIGRAALFMAAVIFIVLAVFAFFVARGLWKGRNWTRIVTIVLSVFEVVIIIVTFFYGGLGTLDIVLNSLSLVVNGLIGGYLAFNKNVKKAFS